MEMDGLDNNGAAKFDLESKDKAAQDNRKFDQKGITKPVLLFDQNVLCVFIAVGL